MKNKRFNHIFLKNLLFISCLIVAFSIIISVIFIWQNNKIQQEKIKLLETEINIKNENIINSMFSEISASCIYFSNMHLDYDYQNLVKDYAQIREIQQKMESIMATFNIIESIKITDWHSKFYITNSDGAAKNFTYTPGNLYGTINGTQIYQNLENSSLYMYLDAQENEYMYNSVYIGISTDRLAELVFNADLETRESCIVDSEGNILLSTFPYSRGDRLTEYHPTKLINGLFEKSKIDGINTYTSVQKLKDYKIFMVNYINESVYRSIISSSTNTIILIAVLITLGALCVIIIIFKITYMPVKEIMQQVNGMAVYKSQVGNEIQFVGKTFSELKLKNKELTVMVEEKLQQLTSQHIAALQMQICPHFIYNTLDFINYMAYKSTKDINNNISIASRKLAEIFKSSMDVREIFRTVREEIELTQIYIDILKLRTEDTFEVCMEVDEALYDCMILKLCMQPLIENIAVHAASDEHPVVDIWISIKEKDGYICVSVSDDGVGIEKDKLIKICEHINDFSHQTTENIGLRNVNERLQELYGSESALKVKSQEGKGTTCSFKYPKEVSPKAEF